VRVSDSDWPLALVGSGFAPWGMLTAVVVIFGTVLFLYRWAAQMGLKA